MAYTVVAPSPQKAQHQHLLSQSCKKECECRLGRLSSSATSELAAILLVIGFIKPSNTPCKWIITTSSLVALVLEIRHRNKQVHMWPTYCWKYLICRVRRTCRIPLGSKSLRNKWKWKRWTRCQEWLMKRWKPSDSHVPVRHILRGLKRELCV